LYRNFHEISENVYLVEISRSNTKVFICLFIDYLIPEQYIAQTLSEKVAFSLMKKHNNLYENFITSFYVAYGGLMIDGYNPKVIEIKE